MKSHWKTKKEIFHCEKLLSKQQHKATANSFKHQIRAH